MLTYEIALQKTYFSCKNKVTFEVKLRFKDFFPVVAIQSPDLLTTITVCSKLLFIII